MQKSDLRRAELPRVERQRRERAEDPALAVDDRAHGTDRLGPGLCDQRKVETGSRRQVGDHQRLVVGAPVFGQPGAPVIEDRLAYGALGPAHASAHEQVFAVGLEFADRGQRDPQRFGDQPRGVVEKLRQAEALQGEAAQLRDGGLLAGAGFHLAFGPAAVRDVARVDDHADQRKARRQRRGNAFQQPPTAVAVPQAALGADVALARLDDALEVGQPGLALVGMDAPLEDVLAQQVVGAVPQGCV